MRVVLLGYMCSGKSTIGASLARRLGWDFIDFDVEIEIERREQRGPLYRLADLSIPSDRRDPAVVAFEIEQTMRTRRA